MVPRTLGNALDKSNYILDKDGEPTNGQDHAKARAAQRSWSGAGLRMGQPRGPRQSRWIGEHCNLPTRWARVRRTMALQAPLGSPAGQTLTRKAQCA